jgi:FkbM family methyltransferase
MAPPPRQHLTPEEESKIRSVLDAFPRNGVFVDLGANAGNVTAVALEYGHTVYAFEPGPAWPVIHNRFGKDERVTLFNKAIGSHSRVVDFHIRKDGNSTDASFLKAYRRGTTKKVEVVPVVDFLRSLPKRADIVKMDIEGAEAECLEAILDAGIHKNTGLFLVETHDRFSADLAERLDAIRRRIDVEHITNIDLTWY